MKGDKAPVPSARRSRRHERFAYFLLRPFIPINSSNCFMTSTCQRTPDDRRGTSLRKRRAGPVNEL